MYIKKNRHIIAFLPISISFQLDSTSHTGLFALDVAIFCLFYVVYKLLFLATHGCIWRLFVCTASPRCMPQARVNRTPITLLLVFLSFVFLAYGTASFSVAVKACTFQHVHAHTAT